jgi:hypothetical protein
MATSPTPATPAVGSPIPQELRIISHSNLFYWWPVWAIGFLLGIYSLLSPYEMAAVPRDTIEAKVATSEINVHPATGVDPATNKIVFDTNTQKKVFEGQVILYHPDKNAVHPLLTDVGVSASKGPGVIFCTILLVVILITNIHLRGLWSLIVIVIIVAVVIILALAGAWDWIFTQLSFLDIRMSTGAYFLISSILLGLWLIIFFLFDPQVYMVFTPGQFKVRLEIGEGETAYDTRGMTVHKVRSDFFRHWILGLGSGDLIVRTTGAQAHEFQLHNVLFVSQKVKVIEDMIARAGR